MIEFLVSIFLICLFALLLISGAALSMVLGAAIIVAIIAIILAVAFGIAALVIQIAIMVIIGLILKAIFTRVLNWLAQKRVLTMLNPQQRELVATGGALVGTVCIFI